MRVSLDDNKAIIYLNKYFLKDLDYSNKEEILKLLLWLKKRVDIDLEGVYDVKVFCNKEKDLILELYYYEELDYLSFNIEVYNECNFLLEFTDYFNVPKDKKVLIYNNKYYIDLDSLSIKELIKYSDFYQIVRFNKKDA